MDERSHYEFIQDIALEENKFPLISFDGFHLWTANLVRMPITKGFLARMALIFLLRIGPPSKFARIYKREAYGCMLADLFAHLFGLPVLGATEPEE